LPVAAYTNGSGSILSGGTKGDIVAFGNVGGDGVIFANSNTEAMRLTSTGLGIGTSSPLSKLHIRYADLTSGSVINEMILEARANGVANSLGALTGITFRNSVLDYTPGSLFLAAGVYGINTDSSVFGRSMGLVFYTSAQDSVAVERLRIDSAGNVGVGTSSPLAALSVGAGSLSDSNVKIQISTGGSGTVSYIGLNKNGNYGGLIGYENGGGLGTGLIIRNVTSTDPIIFVTSNNTERMRITANGNVGIGTTSPAAKLNVVGDAQYVIQVEHNRNNTSSTYNDTISLLNNTNVANNYTQLGFRTTDADGQHHRATILAHRDGSGNLAGVLKLRTRPAGANPVDTLNLYSNGNVKVERGNLDVVGNILASGSITAGVVTARHAVGSYTYGTLNTGTVAPGSTVPGSQLSGGAAGTWRNMNTTGRNITISVAGLLIRIS